MKENSISSFIGEISLNQRFRIHAEVVFGDDIFVIEMGLVVV